MRWKKLGTSGLLAWPVWTECHCSTAYVITYDLKFAKSSYCSEVMIAIIISIVSCLLVVRQLCWPLGHRRYQQIFPCYLNLSKVLLSIFLLRIFLLTKLAAKWTCHKHSSRSPIERKERNLGPTRVKTDDFIFPLIPIKHFSFQFFWGLFNTKLLRPENSFYSKLIRSK